MFASFSGRGVRGLKERNGGGEARREEGEFGEGFHKNQADEITLNLPPLTTRRCTGYAAAAGRVELSAGTGR